MPQPWWFLGDLLRFSYSKIRDFPIHCPIAATRKGKKNKKAVKKCYICTDCDLFDYGMIKCKKCGRENQLGSEICPNCSSQLTTDVFISYSRKDYVDADGRPIKNNIISQIKSSLSAAGISYWFDEDGIYSGDEFASVLTRAIRTSTVFVFISSVNSNASRWTSNEISAAMAFKKPIIPFRIDDSPYNDSVMMKIISFDFIENKNKDRALEQLIRAIRHHVPDATQALPVNQAVEQQGANISTTSILSVEFNELKNAFAKRRKIINIIEAIMLVSFIIGGLVNLFLSFANVADIKLYTALTAVSYIGMVGTYRLMKNYKDCIYWLIPFAMVLGAILFMVIPHSCSRIIIIPLALITILLTFVKKDGKSAWALLEKAPRTIKDDFIYFIMIFVLIIGILGLVPIYLAL
jgi:hypothetical protein